MSTITLKCKTCSTDFEYTKKEYNRQTKKGRSHDSFFCSRSCAMKWKNANRSEETQAKISAAVSRRSAGNQYNKKGNFTQYMRLIGKRTNKECDVDDAYLQEVWNKQGGRCPFTGIEMKLKKGRTTLETASLDRIDSSIGYVKGNVQFVCYAINLAKSNFSDETMHNFIKMIREQKLQSLAP